MLPSRRSGISLIEVLLAATVLSVLVVPMIGLFQMGNRFSIAGEREMQATLFAHTVIEHLRGELDRWTERSNRTVNVPVVRIEPPKGFTYSVNRTPLEKDLEAFTVTVRWRERKVEKKAELKTVISRSPCLKVKRKRARGGFLSRQRGRNRNLDRYLRRKGVY